MSSCSSLSSNSHTELQLPLVYGKDPRASFKTSTPTKAVSWANSLTVDARPNSRNIPSHSFSTIINRRDTLSCDDLDSNGSYTTLPCAEINKDKYRTTLLKSPTPNTDSIHRFELRHPRVNPRKTRRYCIDFGLSRSTAARTSLWSRISNSSRYSLANTATTPLATPEKGLDVTVHEDFQMVFRSSSPISPPLRRIQSSPLFARNEIMFDKCRDYTTAAEKYLNSSRTGRSSLRYTGLTDGRVDGLSKELELEQEGEHLLISDSLPRNAHNQKDCLPVLHSLITDLDGRHRLDASSSIPTTPKSSHQLTESLVYSTPVLQSAELPPLVRKVVSMRSFRNEGTTMDAGPLKSARQPTDSFLKLQMSMEKLKAHKPSCDSSSFSHVPDARIFSVDRSTEFNNVTPVWEASAPSLASAGRQRPSHRSHVSVPLAGAEVPAINKRQSFQIISTSRTPRLNTSSLHPSSSFQPVDVTMRVREAPTEPHSFIDISPNRRLHRDSMKLSRTERMKKFLARANTELIGWSKNLARKKSSMY